MTNIIPEMPSYMLGGCIAGSSGDDVKFSSVRVFSSIGMAKVALESINGFNLFGEYGASWSVIYVDVDAHNRNRTTLETMLPRESTSKVKFSLIVPTASAMKKTASAGLTMFLCRIPTPD